MMKVIPFHDKETGTISYIVENASSKKCAIIDSVLNFDLYTAQVHYFGADAIIDYIQSQNLTVEWILETHIHADHLSAACYLKQKLGGKIGIGSHIKSVFDYWASFFQLNTNACHFDVLFEDNTIFTIGDLNVEVMHTPGHTPACVCYRINNAIFVGDTFFKPESGTSRTDFPGGSAERLYQSIQKILNLPNDTLIYLCHDYPKDGDAFQFVTTVEEEKKFNVMLNGGTSLEEYRKKREARDKILSVPKLLFVSLQVNLLGGQFPFVDTDGYYYLKIPLKNLS